MRYYICNHKANLSKEAYQKIAKMMNKIETSSIVVVCPSTCYLGLDVERKNWKLGAQDVSVCINGDYTGEVTASQLKSLGVSYSLVGHSERRNQFKETSFAFLPKIHHLLENDITPIFCIGEAENVRKKKKTFDILRQQITQVYDSLSKDFQEKIIIAYEPMWAVGTGITPSNEEINEVVEFIKKLVKEKYQFTPFVLYGGSVNESNVNKLRKIILLDGFLLGGVSLKEDSLTKIFTKDE